MSFSADLHTHTTASDSTVTREQLIRIASANGVRYLSITDHDTMVNTGEGLEGNVYLIPGCELSARDGKTGRRVHVLCYFPESTDELEDYFRYMRDERTRVGKLYLENVSARYPAVTMEDIIPFMEKSGTIHKSYILDTLRDFGYANRNYKALYEELFGKGSQNRGISADYGDVRDIVRMAHRSGGFVSIAHPSEYDSMEVTKELITGYPVDGIEVNHPRNKPEDVKILRQWAYERDLVMTGGTDFHGAHTVTDDLPGTMGAEEEELRKMFRRIGRDLF